MSDLGDATRLWIVDRNSGRTVMAQSVEDGVIEPVTPVASLFPVCYLSAGEAQQDKWQGAWNSIHDRFAYLAAKIASPDGPPTLVLLLYGWKGQTLFTYRVGSRPHHGEYGTVYQVAGPGQGGGWESEVNRGVYGYFLIGAPQGSNLWRIYRAEVDHVGRYNFSVTPVSLPHGLPAPDFKSVDHDIREEMLLHWQELERAYVEHRSYALVTAAKNLGEGLLCWKLGDQIGRKRPDIGNLLPALKLILDDKDAREGAPFSDLDYHLLSKLRLLHARTHPERATRDRLTPELALSAAQDIVAVLRSLRLAE
jgi:hypothetical protein